MTSKRSSSLSRKNLHHYQTALIKKAETIDNIGLLLPPGLGKTVTTLTIINEQFNGKTLVIAPKRVAESVWEEEAANWKHLQKLRFSKVLGTTKQREDAFKQPADVYIVNMESFKWLSEHKDFKKITNLVIDESSRFKDPSTQRFKAMKKVLNQFKRKIILTGTPTPQGLQDIWAQVGILDLGERLEKSLTKFRDKYMEPDKRNRHTHVVYTWKFKDGCEQKVKDAISDICFSLKAEDYLELPECSNIYHKLSLSKPERDSYKELQKDLVAEIKGEQITAPTAAVLANKLLQFTSGAVYTEEGDWVPTNNAKLELLESLLEESTTPTLIFYNYKHSLERLQKAFPEAQVLDDSNIQAWRDGKIRVLLAHPQSGGIGLNLQCNVGETAQMVWFDLPWSSENYIQANARIYRQGQKKPVVIHHLTVEDTVDEHVVDVLANKINRQEALLKALNFALV